MTNALAQVKTTIYDYYLGRPTSVTDANQSTSTLAYTDPLDRPTNFALGTASTTIAYNGNVITSTVVQNSCASSGQNVKTEVVYDGLGREAESRRYKNSTTAIVTCKAYDGLGRLAQSSNPDEVTSPGTPCSIAAPKYTATTYDALDRGLTVTHPDSAQISTVWSSNQATVTDEAGRARSSTTDALGRLTRVVENPSGTPSYTTNYSYDALDNLTAVSQLGDGTGGTRFRSFDYDSLKRLKSASNPESGTITYGHLSGATYISGYDDDGNLVERKDAAGVVTSYGYDNLNRLSGKTYTGATPGVNYSYDGSTATKSIGRLIRASTTLQSDNTAAFTTYDSYDEFGRVTKSTQTVGTQPYVFHYTYNAAGGLETEQYPSTRTLTYCYDPAGRPAAVGSNGALSGVLGASTTNYVPTTSYAKHGGIQSMTLGNVWIENHEYDGNAVPATRIQPTRILVTKAVDSTTVLDLRNCYTCGAGNNGNVWTHTIANLGVTQSFGYDAFNRLTSAVENSGGFGQSYVYDAFGNRAETQSSTQLDTPRTPVQNSDSTLPFNASNQWTLATYDPNGSGNQTGVASDTFQYDAENRIKQSTQGSVTATYDYDGESRRVRKISGSTATIYVYDAMGEVAAEYGGTPAPVGGTSYVAVDTLGSSRAEVDSQGNVTRHDYLPFGQEIPNSWGVRAYYNDYARAEGFTRKFTGKERDAETGLDYFGARYFSGAQGRFSSADPLMGSGQLSNPQTWNRYAYGLNNPLRNTDPLGLYDWDTSAGGSYTDAELTTRSGDRSLRRSDRNAAKNALKFRLKFRAGLETASEAADTSGQSTAQGGVAAFGDENDHNGVLVGVAASNVAGSSARTRLNADDTITVNFNPGLKGNQLAVTLGHEGRHVGDALAWWSAGEPTGGLLDLNHYLREERAWYVSSYIAEALGMKREAPRGGGREFQVWNSGWKAVDRETLRSRGVNTILRYMGLSPTDTDTYSREHLRGNHESSLSKHINGRSAWVSLDCFRRRHYGKCSTEQRGGYCRLRPGELLRTGRCSEGVRRKEYCRACHLSVRL